MMSHSWIQLERLYYKSFAGLKKGRLLSVLSVTNQSGSIRSTKRECVITLNSMTLGAALH
jgi:hypothetical protein